MQSKPSYLDTIVFSQHTKQRILLWFNQRMNLPTILRLLLEEDIIASQQGILKFLQGYKDSSTITRKPWERLFQ